MTFLTFSNFSSAETIQILFTEDDSYSIEVAHIAVGDTIKWLPKNEGHNVEFIAGPEMHSLPAKSELNEIHTVIFKIPGVSNTCNISSWRNDYFGALFPLNPSNIIPKGPNIEQIVKLN